MHGMLADDLSCRQMFPLSLKTNQLLELAEGVLLYNCKENNSYMSYSNHFSQDFPYYRICLFEKVRVGFHL